MPMNLKEMSKQYRANAAVLLSRIKQLKAMDVSGMNYSERMKHNGRIRSLESLYSESMSYARYLERYYEEQNRPR